MQKLPIVMAAALAFLAIGAVENARARPLPDGPGGGYGGYHYRFHGRHGGYHYRYGGYHHRYYGRYGSYNYGYHPYQYGPRYRYGLWR